MGSRPGRSASNHTMLHSIFKRAVRDQLIITNPLRAHRAAEGHHEEVPNAHLRRVRAPHHRVWQPAGKGSGVDFPVRMHDVRHARASWLLAEGSDLKSVMNAWATPRSKPPKLPPPCPRPTEKPPRPRPSPTPTTATQMALPGIRGPPSSRRCSQAEGQRSKHRLLCGRASAESRMRSPIPHPWECRWS